MNRMFAGIALAVTLPITPLATAGTAVAHSTHSTHSRHTTHSRHSTHPAHVRPLTGSRIIATGARLRGVRFLWAGTSPRTGFDCSGFTKYVFARLHVRIPRTAAAQYRASRHTRHPRPGDLFFVHDSRGHVYHVGIYVNRHTWLEAEHPGKGVNFYRPWTRHVWYGSFPAR